jgi:hypothetical protein
MASNLDITLKRNNGVDVDTLYPTTTWTQVESKPTTFTPTSHSHGNITDTGTITADTAVASGQKLVLVNGSNQIVRSALAIGTGTTTFLRNDGTWTTPAGGGDVVGPASSVTARIATFNGTTGKLIQDSGTLISGLATSGHLHGNITNAGAIGSTSGLAVVTTTSGVLTTEAKFTNLYTNSTPLTIASGGTQTITFSASASTTGVGTTGLPGTRLRVVWGTTTSTELVTYVTVKPDAGSAPLTYIAEPLDVISGGDVIALLHIKANATGAYSGTSWIVGGGKTRTPAGSDTNSIMYLRSIDRVNF